MARTSSLVTLARKIEKARANLHAAVAAKQRELHDLDAALRRVLGVGGGTKTSNGRAPRTSGGRGGRRGKRGRKAGGAPGAGTLGAHIMAAVGKAGGRPVTIPEVLKAAKAAGFKSGASVRSQETMTANTLSNLVKRGHLRKRGRGKYAAKV